MIAINFTTSRSRFKDFCDRVTGEAEMESRIRKAERNIAYLEKLKRGPAQV